MKHFFPSLKHQLGYIQRFTLKKKYFFPQLDISARVHTAIYSQKEVFFPQLDTSTRAHTAICSQKEAFFPQLEEAEASLEVKGQSFFSTLDVFQAAQIPFFHLFLL